jgi:hypothetical protein
LLGKARVFLESESRGLENLEMRPATGAKVLILVGNAESGMKVGRPAKEIPPGRVMTPTNVAGAIAQEGQARMKINVGAKSQMLEIKTDEDVTLLRLGTNREEARNALIWKKTKDAKRSVKVNLRGSTMTPPFPTAVARKVSWVLVKSPMASLMSFKSGS